MSRPSRFLNMGDEHLDVSVATKATLPWHFEDMPDFRTTKEGTPNGGVLAAELCEDGNDVGCFVFNHHIFR